MAAKSPFDSAFVRLSEVRINMSLLWLRPSAIWIFRYKKHLNNVIQQACKRASVRWRIFMSLFLKWLLMTGNWFLFLLNTEYRYLSLSQRQARMILCSTLLASATCCVGEFITIKEAIWAVRHDDILSWAFASRWYLTSIGRSFPTFVHIHSTFPVLFTILPFPSFYFISFQFCTRSGRSFYFLTFIHSFLSAGHLPSLPSTCILQSYFKQLYCPSLKPTALSLLLRVWKVPPQVLDLKVQSPIYSPHISGC